MKNLINTIKAMVAQSQLAIGTQNLIQDVSNWLLILVPIVGGLCITAFAIARANADEQDKKMWTGRMKTAIISTVIGVCASGIISLVMSYYK